MTSFYKKMSIIKTCKKAINKKTAVKYQPIFKTNIVTRLGLHARE